MDPVITKLIPIFILALLGFIAGKLKLLPDNTSEALCAFLFLFCGPAVSFSNIITSEIKDIFNLRFTLAFIAFELTASLILYFFFRFLFREKGADLVIHIMCSFYGNIAYVGMPVFLSIFNNVIPNLIVVIIHGILTIPIIIFFLDRFTGQSTQTNVLRSALNSLKNPNIFIPVIAILLLFFKIPIPQAIKDAADLLGKPTTPAGMFALGLTCSKNSLQKEQKVLAEAFQADESRFVAVYGRRRVGKTYLIRESMDSRFTFQHTGYYGGKLTDELFEFCASLREYGLKEFTKPKNWLEAFEPLKELIRCSAEKRKVIFLDELSWMDTRGSDFIMALEGFWNGWASARKDILLIVCGSVTSWMLNKIVHNKGGLYNRLTDRIHLRPFSLSECSEYAAYRGLVMSRDPFNHPTVMYRKSAVEAAGCYSNYRKNQDTDLWIKMLSNGVTCMNLSEPVFRFRFDEGTYKKRKSWINTKILIEIRYKAWKSGFNSFGEFLMVAVAQLGMYILPVGFQKFLYQKILRR